MHHHLRIHASIALQQLEDDAVANGVSTTAAFTLPAEIGFIQFNLPRKFAGHAFQFSDMEQHRPHFLVDPIHDLRIYSQVMRQSIGRNLLVESLPDRDLAPKFRKALPSMTAAICTMPASSPFDRQRSAEHASATSQTAGCTPDNSIGLCSHAAASLRHSYKTPQVPKPLSRLNVPEAWESPLP